MTLIAPLSDCFGHGLGLHAVFLATVILYVANYLVTTYALGFPVLVATQVLRKTNAKVTLPLVFGVVLRRSPGDGVNVLVNIKNVIITITPTLKPAINNLINAFVP